MTQDIIRKSSKWRVGDGKFISIWNDKWLLNVSNAKVITPPFPCMENASVDFLFKHNEKRWDGKIIKDLFNQRDANLILSFPLSRNLCIDKLIWAHEQSGNFSVSSCYKALVGEYPEDKTVIWGWFWNLKLPSKIKKKKFMWQVYSNCLPTTDLLSGKHVDCSNLCKMCMSRDETYDHFFCRLPSG